MSTAATLGLGVPVPKMLRKLLSHPTQPYHQQQQQQRSTNTPAAITGTFLAPLALYEFILAARVSLARQNSGTPWGTTTNSTNSTNSPSTPSSSTTSSSASTDPLNLAIRSHGNFTEGVPLALVIAAVAELNGANKRGLTWALALLTVGRVAHVEFGIKGPKTLGVGRLLGTLVTQGFIVGFGGYAAYLVRAYWGW